MPTRYPQSPSLRLFATGAKLLQKGAKVMNFPCEAAVSINSGYTGGYRFPDKASPLHSTAGDEKDKTRPEAEVKPCNNPFA